MLTKKLTVIHPDTYQPVEIDAPVSKLKIPFDIFFNGDDVLIIRFVGATKRRAILETNENNRYITKAKGRVWKFAGVALVTENTILQHGLPHRERTIPESKWNYNPIYPLRP